jgi:CHAD domain-containing protein
MTLNELQAATSSTWDSDAREALSHAILGPHVALGHMFDAANGPWTPHAGSEGMRALADAFMASACRHLVAVEETVLPIARRRLPTGRVMVADYLTHVRQLEHELHHHKARLYGEAHASRRLHRRPWPRIREWLAEHDEREALLLNSIDRTLTADEAHALAHRLAHAAERAPTRPHPHAPHTGLAGRVSHRLLWVTDGFWDTAEGRSIPPTAQPRVIPHNSLLTAYVLGVPAFEDRLDPTADGAEQHSA